ncbi:uncharacterized protein AB9X84_008317 isoform 1-T4 [Acanthopagrus schlegelii]
MDPAEAGQKLGPASPRSPSIPSGGVPDSDGFSPGPSLIPATGPAPPTRSINSSGPASDSRSHTGSDHTDRRSWCSLTDFQAALKRTFDTVTTDREKAQELSGLRQGSDSI